jgi:hypothetical protein
MSSGESAINGGAVCLSPWVGLLADRAATGSEEDLAPEQLLEWSSLYLESIDQIGAFVAELTRQAAAPC